MKGYALNLIRGPIIISGIFLNSGILESLRSHFMDNPKLDPY